MQLLARGVVLIVVLNTILIALHGTDKDDRQKRMFAGNLIYKSINMYREYTSSECCSTIHCQVRSLVLA